MDHKSRTAEELANSYLKEIRSINLMRYLTFAVFIVLIVLLRNRLNVPLTIIFLVVFYIALKFLRSMDIQQLRMLSGILSEDCDAAKYTEILDILLKKSKQNANLLALWHAQGLYASGRFQEASDELEKVYFKRAGMNTQLLYKTLCFDCRLALGGLEAAHQLRQETYNFIQQLKPDQRSSAERTLHFMDSSLALAEERYEDFYAQEERVQAEAANQLQLVSSAFRMGKADLATGNPEDAREHLEDVIAEGNTLYMVAEARRLLGSMVPAELPDNAEA